MDQETPIRVQGMKFCDGQALCTIRFTQGWAEKDSFRVFCGELAAHRINATFLIMKARSSCTWVFCCADRHRSHRMVELARRAAGSRDAVSLLESVSLMSLFPHRFSIPWSGAVFASLARQNICVHASASSISALTLVINTAARDAALRALGSRMEIPAVISDSLDSPRVTHHIRGDKPLENKNRLESGQD